ncbi:proenkephalin-B [Bombina bombina]|uniref:proenkephalin-B n=1 Tax=Bombina bombina TaxID=8345 RepID=UPI00235AA14A|nr:proenkephalin-B [Bombina bombina]
MMEWTALMIVLCLSAPHITDADCVSQCFSCSQQIRDSDTIQMNPLACSLECEGSLISTDEWDWCRKILEGDSKREQEHVLPSDTQEMVVKRYGGFLKKLDKGKFFFNSPQKENANFKEESGKKYGGFLQKYGERELPADTELEMVVPSKNEIAEDDQEWGRDERKRYGGFLRKYPKRSLERALEIEQEEAELQKRYGGFMRRIRPKLKWDNQKRYGGFLRRQFKVTTRSEEEPGSFSGEISNL